MATMSSTAPLAKAPSSATVYEPPDVHVLYVDHQKHPAPLTECFHATASRRLSSCVARYPVSTVEEVDSAYCPQCLSFHDATTAAQLGYCPKVTCRRCPLCLSAASIQVEKSDDTDGATMLCLYKCGLCDWTSKDCNLTAPLPPDATQVQIMTAAEDLGTKLAERRHTANEPLDALMAKATRHARDITRLDANSEPLRHAQDWSIETLEAKLKDKKAEWLSTPGVDKSDLPNIDGFPIKRITAQDDTTVLDDAPPHPDTSLLSFQIQSLDAEPLLPLSMPLTVRKSRRCRAELADGRPGILLKPKLNPLEGDSSLPSGHGQWHRKDSSAIQVIPRVQIVKSRQTSDCTKQFLLKVSNPTLGTVRVRLSKSSYQGEVDYWTAKTSEDPVYTHRLNGLLVNTLHQITANVDLQPQHTRSLQTTSTVELLSAEDSIIDLGGTAREIPDAVLGWGSTIASSATPETALSSIAQSASDAWFELSVVGQPQGPQASKSPTLTGIPLALEVDLGKGSWESSLIQPIADVENDMVTFDLVLVYE